MEHLGSPSDPLADQDLPVAQHHQLPQQEGLLPPLAGVQYWCSGPSTRRPARQRWRPRGGAPSLLQPPNSLLACPCRPARSVRARRCGAAAPTRRACGYAVCSCRRRCCSARPACARCGASGKVRRGSKGRSSRHHWRCAACSGNPDAKRVRFAEQPCGAGGGVPVELQETRVPHSVWLAQGRICDRHVWWFLQKEC